LYALQHTSRRKPELTIPFGSAWVACVCACAVDALKSKMGTLSVDKQEKLEHDVEKMEKKAKKKEESDEKKKQSSKVSKLSRFSSLCARSG
jgi:formate hydrogenlyase subunit 6/NADH:ubiquinone oxidoreductase subunit I